MDEINENLQDEINIMKTVLFQITLFQDKCI